MPSFLVDEDLPRAMVRALRQVGWLAEDVHEAGLQGHSDQEVFRYAQEQGHVLLTADLGFGNLLRFPLGFHAGIVILRFPNEMPSHELATRAVDALRQVEAADLVGNLLVIDRVGTGTDRTVPMTSRKTSVEIDEDLLGRVRSNLSAREVVRQEARREEVEALRTMSGMDLDDPAVMERAWRR